MARNLWQKFCGTPLNQQNQDFPSPRSSGPRIGLFGGTFDPIHLGHLIVAEDAMREIHLDKLFFVPAPSAPLRTEEPETPANERLTMVDLAIRDFSGFETDDFEVRRDRPVPSIETVRHFEKRFPGARLFFIIGGDQVRRLGEWQEIAALKRKVTFVCARREEGNVFSPGADLLPLASRRVDISATEIRRRISRGETVRSLLPSAVADRLTQTGLYRGG